MTKFSASPKNVKTHKFFYDYVHSLQSSFITFTASVFTAITQYINFN